jgi:hypothetical protein
MGVTRVVLNPHLTYNGTEWTEQLISLELPFSREELEATASGDGTRVKVPGLEVWTCTAVCHRNIATGAAGVESLAWIAKEEEKPPALSASAFIFAFADGAVSVTNPFYTSTAYIKDIQIATGAVGALDTMTVTFMAAGTMVRSTSA